MKRFLFMAVLFTMFAASSHAQAPFIKLVNNSNCPVYYRLWGDVAPGCTATYQSRVFVLAAGAIVSYTDPTLVPGGLNCTTCAPPSLTPTDFITAVEFFTSYTPCPIVSAGFVGAPCSGFPATVTGWPLMTSPNCQMCNPSANVSWTATNTVTFY